MSPSLSLRPTLTRHDVERIHEHSLDLLERVGIDYKTHRALEVLEKSGCPVDYDRTWASLPRELVEWALQQSPRVVRLAARDPARDVVLNGRRPHHTTDSQGTQAIDLETGERRDSTAEDLSRGLLFADALDMVEVVNVMVAANDVPAHLRTVRHFALAFTQTSKHVRTGVLHAGQVPFIVEMAKAATGSETFRPIFSVVDCTISPLMHDGPMTEACIELARLQAPIMVYPMPLAGGTSPVTPGGTILLHNVEFLSALVLYQAVNPGTPIIYGTGASQLDMHTGRYGGSADGHGLRLALCDMARFYNLPVNLFGLSSSSYELDALYGYEATSTALLAYLAGADEIYSMGLLGDAQILSLDKMVLDNHLARQVEILARPVLVDEEHLQADLIERVGIGGHYLTQRETRAFTRREYVPMWPPAGKTMLEMAHAEALDILHTQQPPPLPEGAADKIETIVAEADRALA
ncbi:MAG: trimethylamine methyltransferase family protein [Anaerolineae bacterium]|nr:trimethylamine methyltransferase family protein [Anaerolineae bacterium]